MVFVPDGSVVVSRIRPGGPDRREAVERLHQPGEKTDEPKKANCAERRSDQRHLQEHLKEAAAVFLGSVHHAAGLALALLRPHVRRQFLLLLAAVRSAVLPGEPAAWGPAARWQGSRPAALHSGETSAAQPPPPALAGTRRVRRSLPLLSGDAAHHRVRVPADHHAVSRGPAARLHTGGNTRSQSELWSLSLLQAVFGCLIQAFMVGLVFSKLARPQLRTKTVIFSQRAVVSLRDRRLCLIFRIGDLRDDNFILGTKVGEEVCLVIADCFADITQDAQTKTHKRGRNLSRHENATN